MEFVFLQSMINIGRPKKSKEFCRFRCTICNAASSRKFNLQRHVNSHHPNATNCIVDLLPPKNPRQVRPKMEGGLAGGDDGKSLKPLDYNYRAAVEAAEYYRQLPEGVNLDSAMDLSISPSPGTTAPMPDDVSDSRMTDGSDDLAPISAITSVASDAAMTMAIDSERLPALTHDALMTSPAAVASGSESTKEARKRVGASKGKRSLGLDSMLLNKFGKYHDNFADDVTAQKPATPFAPVASPVKQDEAGDEMSDATDDEGLTIDEVPPTCDDVSTDANANNKQDAMTSAAGSDASEEVKSPDVNGNSKSSANEEEDERDVTAASSSSSCAVAAVADVQRDSARDAYEERMRQELVSQSKPVTPQLDTSMDASNTESVTSPAQQVLGAKSTRREAAKSRSASLRTSTITTRRSSAALREEVEAN